MKTSHLILGCAVMATGFSGAAQAQTAQNDLTAQLTAPSACTLSTATLDFGTPSPSATSLDNSAVVTVSCSITTTFNLAMDSGQNASGAQRQMLGSTGDFLAYNLYRNSARTQAWGTGAQSLFGAVAAAVPADFTIYGRVPSLTPSALNGTYLDTVVMTLTF